MRLRDGNEGLDCIKAQDFCKLQKLNYIYPPLPALKTCDERLIFAELRSEIRLRKADSLTLFD